MMSSKNFKVAMYLALMTSLLYTSYVSAGDNFILNNYQISFNITSLNIMVQKRTTSGAFQTFYDKHININMAGRSNEGLIGYMPATWQYETRVTVTVKSEYNLGGDIKVCRYTALFSPGNPYAKKTLHFNVWRDYKSILCRFGGLV